MLGDDIAIRIIIKDAKFLFLYWKFLKKYRPNIILTYTAKPNVYVGFTAQLLHIPVISNVTGLGSIIKQKGLKQKIIMQLFKKAYGKASCIMFQNSTNLELARKLKWIKGDYKLIPGSGVDLNRFSIQSYPNGGDGIIGEPVIFNYIGRVLFDKGIDDYLEAAKIIKKKFPNTEFNVIGFIESTEKHYELKLKSLQCQGIVNYRGSQMDVRPWIARAHAIIHPSTYGEGMSNVLLENAASGRPIITTDNPGCKETVIENVSGYVYPCHDVDALISCIVNFLN